MLCLFPRERKVPQIYPYTRWLELHHIALPKPVIGSDKLWPWPSSCFLLEPQGSNFGNFLATWRLKETCSLPSQSLQLWPWVATRSFWHGAIKKVGCVQGGDWIRNWHRNRHRAGAQGTGLGLTFSSSFRQLEERDGMEYSHLGNPIALGVLRPTTSNKGASCYSFPRAEAKVFFLFNQPRLLCSQPGMLCLGVCFAWCSLLSASLFHNSLKSRLNSQPSFFGV